MWEPEPIPGWGWPSVQFRGFVRCQSWRCTTRFWRRVGGADRNVGVAPNFFSPFGRNRCQMPVDSAPLSGLCMGLPVRGTKCIEGGTEHLRLTPAEPLGADIVANSAGTNLAVMRSRSNKVLHEMSAKLAGPTEWPDTITYERSEPTFGRPWPLTISRARPCTGTCGG
jgi:hypothetical protein